jgi:two-component system chemotaxis response regulator CheY
MAKRVLDIGNCDADHTLIRGLIEREFSAQVVRCHEVADALDELRDAPPDLVLVNRILDRDQSEGLEIIRTIKADAQLRQIPCMMLTNFAEHQARATAMGAESGFGKAQLDDKATREKLARFLD